MDCYVYGSKGALAMLSDEANRHLLTDAERASIDRLLPWTRMLRPGPVTVTDEPAGGTRTVQLEDYAYQWQDELILKPTLLYAGNGVVQGWHCTPEQWREQLAAAMGGPYLVQRRVHPVPELFPSEHGLQPWTLVWASFNMINGPSGVCIRGQHGTDPGVINHASGATARAVSLRPTRPGEGGVCRAHP